MKKLIRFLSPFKKLTVLEKRISTVAVGVILFTLWFMSGKTYIPTPLEIAKAYPSLLEQNDLGRHFIKSLFFCLKCMGYSILISLVFCYICRIPIFESFCEFMRKFRFLPSAGLSFLFMKLTSDIDHQMTAMMVFGITTWMIYEFVGVAMDISEDEVQYARSLRLSRWESLRELLIYGKAADLFGKAIGVFAIAWMLLAAVENIAKASGGIGVVLAETNKYFKMEKVYAVQFLILFTGITVDWVLRGLKAVIFPYSSLKSNI